MTTFNKTSLGNIRSDINTALAQVSKKYGIELGIGNISFTENTFSTKLTASAVGNSTAQKTSDSLPGNVAMRAAFVKNASYLGFKSSDLGSKVMFQGEECVLVGARMKAKAKLVVAKKDGSLFAAQPSNVKVL